MAAQSDWWCLEVLTSPPPGFDTTGKTFAALVSNVAVDALCAQKYFQFVRLMGCSASTGALEVALFTKPNT